MVATVGMRSAGSWRAVESKAGSIRFGPGAKSNFDRSFLTRFF